MITNPGPPISTPSSRKRVLRAELAALPYKAVEIGITWSTPGRARNRSMNWA
jgi:hypothetical protein